jgi:hypothetical protein
VEDGSSAQYKLQGFQSCSLTEVSNGFSIYHLKCFALAPNAAARRHHSRPAKTSHHRSSHAVKKDKSIMEPVCLNNQVCKMKYYLRDYETIKV